MVLSDVNIFSELKFYNKTFCVFKTSSFGKLRWAEYFTGASKDRAWCVSFNYMCDFGGTRWTHHIHEKLSTVSMRDSVAPLFFLIRVSYSNKNKWYKFQPHWTCILGHQEWVSVFPFQSWFDDFLVNTRYYQYIALSLKAETFVEHR